MRATFLLALMAAAIPQNISECRKDNCLKPGPVIEVGHCYKVTAVETFEEIACPLPTSGTLTIPGGAGTLHGDCTTIPNPCQYFPTVPFDVPPKDKVDDYVEILPSGKWKYTHHRTCEDKSRFLLISEDSHWHCLLLNGVKP